MPDNNTPFPCPDHVYVDANVWRSVWEGTDYGINLNGIPGAYDMIEGANPGIPDIRHVAAGTRINIPPELCEIAGGTRINIPDSGPTAEFEYQNPLSIPSAYDMTQGTPQYLIPSYKEVPQNNDSLNWLMPTGILSTAVIAAFLVMMIRRKTMNK